jgi:hypothetical protein
MAESRPPIGTCDRCRIPVRKYGTKSINKDGRVLILCGHHTTEHRPALVKQGWTVVDAEVVLESMNAADAGQETLESLGESS